MPLARRLTVLSCLALLALGAAACGDEEPGVDEPAREGLALPLDGIDYNVFITRQLNPAIPADDAFYKGGEPAPDETIYGVFVQVCNNSGDVREPTDSFKVVDNQGNEFEPEELPEDNDFAYRARELDNKECIPESGSIAQQGPTGGAMLLFRFPLQTVENRPLELEIEGEGGEKLTYELDL